MIKMAVVSGKGGTGKTMVSAALADLNPDSQILADCDVEAANLRLLLNAELQGQNPFYGLEAALIDQELCISCGTCFDNCRFGAISEEDGRYEVQTMHCEGCAVCELVCPEDAIKMVKVQNGELFVSKTNHGILVHARLYPGSGTSGLLVSQVKGKAEELAENPRWMLVDGPPGTGCPLIATVSGMDAVLVVTEPSVSALHDLKRVVNVSRRFGPKIAVVINRFDLEPEICQRIRDYCEEEGLAVVGEIPFDPQVVEAVRQGLPISRCGGPASEAMKPVWDAINRELI